MAVRMRTEKRHQCLQVAWVAFESRACRGKWVWRGEFVVGSGDSRCRHFVSDGAREDELGFAI